MSQLFIYSMNEYIDVMNVCIPFSWSALRHDRACENGLLISPAAEKDTVQRRAAVGAGRWI